MNDTTPQHKKLEEIRDGLGYTQREMAEALHISQPRYNAMEKGKHPFSAGWSFAISAMEYLAKKRLLKLFLRTLR
ncbi:MAG TPA: hypothetical protein DCS09_02595 [Porphyromonadaceae bacterium]|nr:hypothetical protein [Porphyromonadaceae bacterium]